MILEARKSVRELQAERASVEVEIQTMRERAEANAGQRREELEQELADLRRQQLDSFEDERKQAVEAERNKGFEDGRCAGFEEGYSTGRQAGYTEARESELGRIREETERLLPCVRSLVDEITTRRTRLGEGARSELIQFAVEIAKRVIKREVRDFHSEIVIENLSQAVDLIFLRKKVTVQLNPDDLEVVEKFVPAMLESFGGVESFEVRPVSDIAPGGCRVVSGSGTVDLSLDVQLRAIEDALLDGVAEVEAAERTETDGIGSEDARTEEVVS